MTARGASSAWRAGVISATTMVPLAVVVGVVAALPDELWPLLHATPAVGETRTVNLRILTQAGGIGAAAADRAARSLVDAGAKALVSWGFAAGLDPSLAPGTLVISTQTDPPVEATYDASGWAARVSERLQGKIPLVHGTIACPDHVVRTTREKRTLAASGAVAADMESAAIAAVASAHGIRCLGIRVILDTANMILPDAATTAIDASGRLRMGRFLGALIRRPMDIVSLPALASARRRAMRTLATVVEMTEEDLLVTGEANRIGYTG